MLSFETSKSDKGYYWRLKAQNGRTLLSSEEYTSLSACQQAAKAAQTYLVLHENYTVQRSPGGGYRIMLISPNGQVLGRSDIFSNASDTEAIIRSITAGMQHPGGDVNEELPLTDLTDFIKLRRKKAGLTQEELAQRAGVGLRFLRELEQGKDTLRMDKVNQVLKMFGHELGPMRLKRNHP